VFVEGDNIMPLLPNRTIPDAVAGRSRYARLIALALATAALTPMLDRAPAAAAEIPTLTVCGKDNPSPLCSYAVALCTTSPGSCIPAQTAAAVVPPSRATAPFPGENSGMLPARLEALDAHTLAGFRQWQTYTAGFSIGYRTTREPRWVSPYLAEFSVGMTGPTTDDANELVYRIYDMEASAMMFSDMAGRGDDAALRPTEPGPVTFWQFASPGAVEPTKCIAQVQARLSRHWVRCVSRRQAIVAISTFTLPLSGTADPAQAVARSAIGIAATLSTEGAESIAEFIENSTN
jgi:hypothetical protein